MLLITNWKEIPKSRRLLVLILFIISIIVTEGFGFWFITLPRFEDTLIWAPLFAYLAIGIMISGVVIPLIVIFEIQIGFKHKRSIKKIPHNLSIVFLFLVMVLPLGALGYISPYHQSGDKAPQILIVEQTGVYGVPDVAVVFYSDKATINSVDFGTVESNLDQNLSEQEKGREHAFILADLIPDTTYFYQINGEGTIYNFTSFPTDDYHFAISSDPHIGQSAANLTATKSILKTITTSTTNYDALFCLGDIVEYGFNDQLYTDFFTTFSPYITQVPFRNVIGNHDALFSGDQLWKDYFYPEDLPHESEGTQFWQRLDFGDIHIFLLDLEWGIERYSAEQQSWFEAQLQTIDADDWTIVMSHAFYYASSTEYSGLPWYDNQEMIATFHQMFIDYDVDLVFSGHDHQMEHIAQDTVDYFIVGAFGGHLDEDPTYYSENSMFFDNTHFGFVDLHFGLENVSLSFRTPENENLYSIDISK